MQNLRSLLALTVAVRRGLVRRPSICRVVRCTVGVCLLLWPAFFSAQSTRGVEAQPPAITSLSPGAYYALLIGIDNYPSLPHLGTAVHDAQTIGAMLESNFNFKGHVFYLLNQDATRARIMEALEGPTGYVQTLTASDNLLVYYAGHGYYNQRTDKAYWLPYDAESAFSANHISADDLTTAVRGIASHHVLIISDSCYSGDLTRGVDDSVTSAGDAAFIERMLAGPSRSILSSGGNEPVADSGPGGHSVFAAALLRALSEQHGTMFTAADLAAPVREMVRAHSGQIPEYLRIGNSMPRDFPIDIGDFVFTRANGPPDKSPNVSASPSSTPGSRAGAPGIPSVDDEFSRGHTLFYAEKYAEALPLLTDACNRSHAIACTDLAWLYNNAGGVEKDSARAASLYRKGCDGGSKTACSNLGMFYELGNGVQQDIGRAAALYKQGCDMGGAYGCVRLGMLRETGKGVEKDLGQAATLYRQGCDDGEPAGCTDLGLIYEYGRGVEKDQSRAATLYGKACDFGGAVGCKYFAEDYEIGNGVDKDVNLAIKYYRKACEGADQEACASLKRLNP